MKRKQPDKLDFWYALRNTEVLVMPRKRLETFGSTILNYYMISELMDAVNQVRVREGRIQSYRPQILIPSSDQYSKALDGFGEEARRYFDWLKEHGGEIQFLKYGFRIKKEDFSEQVLSDGVGAVTEKVKEEVQRKNDPFSAVLLGVDDPWEVCLLKLMHEVMNESIETNVRELGARKLIGSTDGVPNVVVNEIEAAFRAAARDPSKISNLAARLDKHGLFSKYEDRFFALVKSAR